MATDPRDPRDVRDPIDRAGAKSTRLGLVALGFVVGVLVTLIAVFAFDIRS